MTCTKDGQEVAKCEKCGITMDSRVVPAKGHTESIWIIDQEPTESMSGIRHKECLDCGELLKLELIPALKDHICAYDEWTTIVEATCTTGGQEAAKCKTCGETLETRETEPKGHTESDWIIDKKASGNDSGKKHTECVVCGDRMREETISAPGFGCGGGSVVSLTSLPVVLLGASVCVLLKKRRDE
jgi:hypothetical protein